MPGKTLIFAVALLASSHMELLEARGASEMGKEPLVYEVNRLSESIEIDGNWDKPAWKKITPLVINQHMGEAPKHRPGVQAKLAWDDSSVYIIYRVEDQYVRAVAEKYQDSVCRDSCAEFFFTPGTDLGLSYFNIEVNCGGTMLFWWHPEDGEGTPVAAEDADQFEIAHSLPKIIDPEIADPTTWTLEYRMPFSVLQKYCPSASKPAAGVTWKANLYKCGDATSHPHWLTWSYVDNPTPSFHIPSSFGTLKFQ